MEQKQKFAGGEKFGGSVLYRLELRLVDKTINFIPKWIETYHLTTMTLVWSGLIVLFGYLSTENINYLWLVSLMVIFQYITDLFDGKVGKIRNTGLIKWGFYMDHFLDYIFLGSILTAYSFLIPEYLKTFAFMTAIVAIGFMMNSYLSFAATNKFKISYFGIGPTEGRILFILANTFIILFGVKYILMILPYILLVFLLGLAFLVYQSHKQIWRMDMEEKMSQNNL